LPNWELTRRGIRDTWPELVRGNAPGTLEDREEIIDANCEHIIENSGRGKKKKDSLGNSTGSITYYRYKCATKKLKDFKAVLMKL
jgi:hypothetical protein